MIRASPEPSPRPSWLSLWRDSATNLNHRNTRLLHCLAVLFVSLYIIYSWHPVASITLVFMATHSATSRLQSH